MSHMAGRRRRRSESDAQNQEPPRKKRRVNAIEISEETQQITKHVVIKVDPVIIRTIARQDAAVISNKPIQIGEFTALIRIEVCEECCDDDDDDLHNHKKHLKLEVGVTRQESSDSDRSDGAETSSFNFSLNVHQNKQQIFNAYSPLDVFPVGNSASYDKILYISNISSLTAISFNVKVLIYLPKTIIQAPSSDMNDWAAKILHRIEDDDASADIEIVVRHHGEEHVTRCHKAVLRAVSPVFHAMLGSNFGEANDNRIVLDDFSPCVVQSFVKFLYSGISAVEEIAKERELEWDRLFVIAEKYGVEELCQVAVKKMMKLSRGLRLSRMESIHLCTSEDLLDEKKNDSPSRRPMRRSARLQARGLSVSCDEGLAEDDGKEHSEEDREVLQKKKGIRQSNVLFCLLTFLVEYSHLDWLMRMELDILNVIRPPLMILFRSKDVRFDKVSREVLFKLLRDA